MDIKVLEKTLKDINGYVNNVIVDAIDQNDFAPRLRIFFKNDYEPLSVKYSIYALQDIAAMHNISVEDSITKYISNILLEIDIHLNSQLKFKIDSIFPETNYYYNCDRCGYEVEGEDIVDVVYTNTTASGNVGLCPKCNKENLYCNGN